MDPPVLPSFELVPLSEAQKMVVKNQEHMGWITTARVQACFFSKAGGKAVLRIMLQEELITESQSVLLREKLQRSNLPEILHNEREVSVVYGLNSIS